MQQLSKNTLHARMMVAALAIKPARVHIRAFAATT
jgi:hypothetical protein